jgi:hypothetical protein
MTSLSTQSSSKAVARETSFSTKSAESPADSLTNLYLTDDRWIAANQAQDLLNCGRTFIRENPQLLTQRTIPGQFGGWLKQVLWRDVYQLGLSLGVELTFPRPIPIQPNIPPDTAVWDKKRLADEIGCDPKNIPKALFEKLGAFKIPGKRGFKWVFPAVRAQQARTILRTPDPLTIPGLAKLIGINAATLHEQITTGYLGDRAEISKGRVLKGRLKPELVLPYVLYRYTSKLSRVVRAMQVHDEFANQNEVEKWQKFALTAHRIATGKTHYAREKAFEVMGYKNLTSWPPNTFVALGAVYLESDLFFPKAMADRYGARRKNPGSYPITTQYLEDLTGVSAGTIWGHLVTRSGLPSGYESDKTYPRDLVLLGVISYLKENHPSTLPKFFGSCESNLYGADLLGFYLARHSLDMLHTQVADHADSYWRNAICANFDAIQPEHIKRYASRFLRSENGLEPNGVLAHFGETFPGNRRIWLREMIRSLSALIDPDLQFDNPPKHLNCSLKAFEDERKRSIN